MQERRTSPRKRSFLKGTVYYNNRLSSTECLVRDLSEHGAKLQFSAPVTLPDTVELYIPVRDQTFHAEVRWHAGDEVGLSFGTEPPAVDGTAPSGDLAQRVAALEREVSKLHRQVLDIRTEFKRLRGED